MFFSRISCFSFARCLTVCRPWLVAAMIGLAAGQGVAQTKIPLPSIAPGTEQVQLITNGDFQSVGSLVNGRYPSPTGWTRAGDMFATAGTNTVAADGLAVAVGYVSNSPPSARYQRTVILQPNTDYIFSAYLWNFGDGTNRVTTVLDFNDVPGEPQITLAYPEANAARGYFVYRSFNTTLTGTNVTVRAFFGSPVGSGAAAGYFPMGAQWDNLAITPAAAFRPPTNGWFPLSIQRLGGGLELAWPTSAMHGALHSTTNLATPVVWRDVTNAARITNGASRVAVSLSNQVLSAFRVERGVDPSTLNRKLLMGYQGWFACPADGSLPNRWVHWFRNQNPVATNATVDFLPDTSEMDADELFNTGMTYSNGTPVKVFSSFKQKTVVRHFKWMKEDQLDGVFLQRFVSSLSDPAFFALRNQVADNVRLGAETYGRVFAMMYDISGQATTNLFSKLTNDWTYLVNTRKITSSPRYQRHNGKPVVAIWGFGFSGRSDTPALAQSTIDWFKAQGCTVMGGVPSSWRTLNSDAQSDPAWAAVFRSFDVISPWSVGRYDDNASADSFAQNFIGPDLAAATTAGRDYLPVIFPGFSWKNLNGGALNQIPRQGGNFYWRQTYNAINAGCTMIYGAMFDEVDEGTAMFKMVTTPAGLPAQGSFVPLNIDGQNLPSDWYLRVANEAGKMLRSETPLQPQVPITP